MDFTDINSSDFYAKEIGAVTEHGLMSGMDDGSFSPNRHVPAGHFMCIISRILNFGRDPNLPINTHHSRESEHGHWAEGYINYCRALKIDYPANQSPNYMIKIADALDIMDQTSSALSQTLNYKFTFNRSECMDRYDLHISLAEITRAQLACLLYYFCNSIGIQISEHEIDETHYLNDNTFVLTAEAFFFLSFTNSELFQLVFLLRQYTFPKTEIYKSMKELLKIKQKIMEPLKYNEHDIIYHYTKISTVIALAPTSSGFRLSNSAFLNDPSEGKLLIPMLQKCIPTEIPFVPFSRQSLSNNTYLACFNPSDESLPMWLQYGDNTTGCAIGFDPKQFGLPVYKVSYDMATFSPFFAQVTKELKNFSQMDESPFKKDALFALYLYILLCFNGLRYLCKDPHYKHENELRIVTSCHPKFAEKEDYIREGELFHRTFVSVPYKIRSVTFGANVMGPERLAVGLASTGLDCIFLNSSIPFKN